MKTKIRILMMAGFFFSMFINGCKKEKNDAEAEFNAKLLDIISDNQPTKHHLTMSASEGGTIIGANTRFRFSPNAFTDAAGNIVSGNVQLEIQEFYTKAQMILGNKATMSADGPLDSRGEVYINATQNGQQLNLKPGSAIIQFEATAYNEPMSLFTGVVSGDVENIMWTPVDSSVVFPSFTTSVDTIADTTPVPQVVFIDPMANVWDTLYTFPFTNFGWINCDDFPAYPKTNMTVNIPSGYTSGNTILYVAFNSIRGVMNANYSNNTFMCYSAPIGQQATIVALNYHDGSWYSSFTPITITTNHVQTLSFSPTTIAEYTVQVNTLQ
jgi:hypothetical protein